MVDRRILPSFFMLYFSNVWKICMEINSSDPLDPIGSFCIGVVRIVKNTVHGLTRSAN